VPEFCCGADGFVVSVVELCKVAKAHPPASTSRPARSRGIALFAGLAMLYFAVGYLLMMRYNLFDPDAPSRVANAGYVLESRDPHLSAVGFVWNPLPSLVEVPILQLSRWWPELCSWRGQQSWLPASPWIGGWGHSGAG
jgi:hypothetical protein